MSYQLADGMWVDLKFEGDIFETEDQRNWIDGSYKTTIGFVIMVLVLLVRPNGILGTPRLRNAA